MITLLRQVGLDVGVYDSDYGDQPEMVEFCELVHYPEIGDQVAPQKERPE